MNTRCASCGTEYDDTYRQTSCPHAAFEMHTAVFVNGVAGCAHTVEELSGQAEAPHTDCPVHLLREAVIADTPLGEGALRVGKERYALED
jgi:hypothetical protein